MLCCLAGGRWLSLEQVTDDTHCCSVCVYLSQVYLITWVLPLQVPPGSMEHPFL